MRVLRSRLLEAQQRKAATERAEQRRTLIGSGDRSQRIRTYNFPQNRVTDHRVPNLTLYKLDQIMQGDLDELIERLLEFDRQERLQAAGPCAHDGTRLMANPDERQTGLPERWTVQRVLEWTTAYLKRRGSETPRLDAELLLAHARHCDRIQLYTHFDEELTEEERATMRELVARRAQHEPVAYLIGRREFFGLEFHVEPGVFIPRPETETLVMELLELARDVAAPHVLDLGTGSGCVAIAFAVQRPEAYVLAVDVSEKALAVARKNAARHQVAHRVHFVRSDLFECLRRPREAASAGEEIFRDRLFDFVVSNPPYVAEEELSSLQPDVRLHEPPEALTSGPSGLETIERILKEAPEFLAPHGSLLLEIAPEQADAVKRLAAKRGEYGEIRFAKDLAGHRRVAVIPRMAAAMMGKPDQAGTVGEPDASASG